MRPHPQAAHRFSSWEVAERGLGPEPVWPPAFALRGPVCDFRLSPMLRPNRFTRAFRDGCRRPAGRFQCPALFAVRPFRNEAHDGRKAARPSGLRGFRPPDSPAPRLRGHPQSQIIAGKGLRSLKRLTQCPARSSPPHAMALVPDALPTRRDEQSLVEVLGQARKSDREITKAGKSTALAGSGSENYRGRSRAFEIIAVLIRHEHRVCAETPRTDFDPLRTFRA